MSRMKLSQDQPMDMTLVPNYFIDQYMKDANDAQIKVYLYLLHLVSAGRDTSISDIADIFNHTEKDVLRAISYWEKKNLLQVSYDEAKEIRAIRFLTPQADREPIGTPAPIVSLIKTQRASVPSPEGILPTEAEPDIPEKSSFSADELADMKNSTDFGQILSVAEGYLARSLSLSDIQSLAFIYDTLGFSFELMDYLIEYCVGKGKRKFTYIEQVARNWHTNRITTVAQARDFNYQYNREVYLIMKALGRRTDPTQVEADYVKRWYNEYGFDEDVILEACERTVRKVDKNRFEYAEGILAKWHAGGVHHIADVEKADQEYAGSRPEKSQSSRKSKDSFNHFTQRKYDYAALEKELIKNG